MNRSNQDRRQMEEQRSLGRLDALSDGVFAIAITLLVLNLEVPRIPRGLVSKELPGELTNLLPDLFSYVFSFLIIGSYWMAHNAVLRSIRGYDRGLAWLNILFLMFVAFLPFPTALFDTYPSSALTVSIYAGGLAIARLPLSAMWWYATRDRGLIHDHIQQNEVRLHRIRGLGIPLVFLLSVGISWINIKAAIASWILLLAVDLVVLRLSRS